MSVLLVLLIILALAAVETWGDALPLPRVVTALVLVGATGAGYWLLDRVVEGSRARAAAASQPSTTPEGHLVLRHPLSLRVLWTVGASCVAVFLAILVAFAVTGWDLSRGERIGLVVFIVSSIAGAFMKGRELFARVTIRPDVLEGWMPPGRARSTTWGDVTSVEYDAWDKALVISAGTGHSIHASVHLCGIRRLYEELRQRVPRENWKSVYAPFEQSPGPPVG